jgi:putative hydrolase of the HAD superfamily
VYKRQALGQRFGLSYEQMDELVFNSESARQATTGSISEEEHWRSIAERLELPPAEIEAFRAAFWGGDRADQALLDYLNGLRPAICTALLSNAWSNARADLVEFHGLNRVFDLIIYSAEIGLAKPDPRIYQYALKQLDVRPEESVFVDDMPANVEAARAVGMHAIQFQNSQQTREALENLIQR